VTAEVPSLDLCAVLRLLLAGFARAVAAALVVQARAAVEGARCLEGRRWLCNVWERAVRPSLDVGEARWSCCWCC
jgi:hypothetical protein